MEDLPTRTAFDPWGDDLGAADAWRNFGGLSIEEAKAKFRENPLKYQEDFMWMGREAFRFYFPVIDCHLRNVPAGPVFDDEGAWIIAQGILSQVRADAEGGLGPVLQLIDRLANYVLGHLERFGATPAERQRVERAWRELGEAVR